MKKHVVAALAGVLLSAVPAASFAEQQIPHHAALAGFHSLDGPRGGRRLSGIIKGPFSSPAEALGATLRRLRTYFTGPLPVSSAVQSQGCLIVFFSGHVAATSVVGMTVIAPTRAGDAAVQAVFDTPQRAARSLRHLASLGHAASMRGAAIAPAQAELSRQRFADGSGTIGVPDGWRLNGGNRGMVDVAGPDGAEAHIAIQFPIWDPRGGLADPRRMQLPFIDDPVQALSAVTKRVYFTRNEAAPNVDILDVHAVNPPLGSGRAALVHGRTHGAQPLEFVTLSNSAPLSGSAWMFYATTLSAPPERFARDYPVMLAIWKSYQVDAGYQRSVQADTANTLSQAANIINGATQRSITAQEQANAGVDNIINGQEVMETTSDGTHWLGNADAAQTLAQKFPDKYRILTIDQYRSGDY